MSDTGRVSADRHLISTVADRQQSRRALDSPRELQPFSVEIPTDFTTSMLSASDGLVIIDVVGCSLQKVSESYHDFGLLCARGEVRCVLLRTGDEDPDAHYALQDVLRTVARVAGIRLRFRLAIVISGGVHGRTYVRLRTMGM